MREMKYDQIKIIHCDLFIQQSLYLTSSQNFKLLKKLQTSNTETS